MNKVSIIFIFCLTVFNCKAQTISLEEANVYFLSETQGIPDNITYIKDINNTLDAFLGTWKVEENDITFEFSISKITGSLVETQHDILIIRYKISNENGNILHDTTNLPDNDLALMQGSYFMEDLKTYVLRYYGDNFKCGQFGDVAINLKSNVLLNNKLEFYFVPGHDIIDSSECPNPLVFPFPANTLLTFTKQ